MGDARHLDRYPLHLAANGRALELDRFTGEPAWYASYEQQFAIDGAAGRLVSWHSFDSSWNMWEMHPGGDEVVLCVDGAIELVQEVDGHLLMTRLSTGQWAINKAGTWHTANQRSGRKMLRESATSADQIARLHSYFAIVDIERSAKSTFPFRLQVQC